MIYTILSTLPSSVNPEHNFACQYHHFYYKTEEEANKVKAEMDRKFPEWNNEVVALIDRY